MNDQKITVGSLVRILTPADGVERESAGRVGTICLVLDVDDDGHNIHAGPATPPAVGAHGWWYSPDQLELVEPSAGAGWYKVEVWCDDSYTYIPVALVWAEAPLQAILANDHLSDPTTHHPDRASRLVLPDSPAVGAVVPL